MVLASKKESTSSRPSNEAEGTLLLHQQLEEFLFILKDDTQKAAANFVTWLGCGSLEELAVFGEEDLRGHLKEYKKECNNKASTTTSIPPICQTKLLTAANHLRRGASLSDLRGLFGTTTRGSACSKMIHLQVGEERFTTKQSTLCRVSGFFGQTMEKILDPQ
jgi:hypothetical protein